MKFPRIRLTVFRSLLVVAVAAIFLHLGSEWLRSRRERMLEVADWHARTGAEYRRNAGKNFRMSWVAVWHDSMRKEYERAAGRPWVIPRRSSPFPPSGWTPPPVMVGTGS